LQSKTPNKLGEVKNITYAWQKIGGFFLHSPLVGPLQNALSTTLDSIIIDSHTQKPMKVSCIPKAGIDRTKCQLKPYYFKLVQIEI